MTFPGSEQIAKSFHETYERLAPDFGYKTREASAVPWEEVPHQNKALMVEVVSDLLFNGIIQLGDVTNDESDWQRVKHESYLDDIETKEREVGH